MIDCVLKRDRDAVAVVAVCPLEVSYLTVLELLEAVERKNRPGRFLKTSSNMILKERRNSKYKKSVFKLLKEKEKKRKERIGTQKAMRTPF